MSLLANMSLFLGAYLAAGRVGLVATCMLAGLNWWQTLVTSFFVDLLQIPAYGLALEKTRKHIKVPVRIKQWLEHKTEKIQQRMASGKLLKRLEFSKPIMVVAVSLIPFRGFGVLSACILAFLSGYGRCQATLLIMVGSIISAAILISLFYYPVRILYVS